MARVDFYVLQGSGDLLRKKFACRLAEKAYRLKHLVHIHAADSQSAGQLDSLLWTYRDGSFVPHEMVRDGQSDIESPITIGHSGRPGRDAELLINLTDAVPPENGAFPRIAEIVTSDDESRRRSRERYAQYRDLGHSLQTHKL